MCGKNLKKFDHTDCKMSTFKVKKQVFQYIVRLDYLTLNLLKLNFTWQIIHELDDFLIIAKKNEQVCT